MDLADANVDTTEERLLFFDVQKDLYTSEHVYLACVCVRVGITVPLEQQLHCQSFILRITDGEKQTKEFIRRRAR